MDDKIFCLNFVHTVGPNKKKKKIKRISDSKGSEGREKKLIISDSKGSETSFLKFHKKIYIFFEIIGQEKK